MGRRTWLAAGLVVAFLAFDFIGPAFPFYAEPCGMFAVWGVIVGQINLIAAWGALGPGNVVVRLPWSILLGVLTWYAVALGFRAWRSELFHSPDFVLLGPVILGGVVVAQIPLWIARRSFRWRLINLKDGDGGAEDRPLQFNVRHVLLVMLLVALALGPARLVLPSTPFGEIRHAGQLSVILGVFVATNLAITVPCIWGALVKSNPVPPQIWPVFCAVVTGVEFGVLCLLFGPPGRNWLEMAVAFLLFNLLQCATVYFVLRRFRAAGFRLVRVSPT